MGPTVEQREQEIISEVEHIELLPNLTSKEKIDWKKYEEPLEPVGL